MEINGVAMELLPRWVKVRFERIVITVGLCIAIESAVMLMVRPQKVLEVIDGEPRLWPNAAALKRVSDQRAGKAKRTAAPMFWTDGQMKFQAINPPPVPTRIPSAK